MNHRGDQDRGFRCDASRPLALLEKCPVYLPTPLEHCTPLAQELGLRSVMIKDESHRMRLGSFKALGGVFAIAQMICERSGEIDPSSEKAKEIGKELCFVTASAGNHGQSVAAGARLFGARALVILPSSAPEEFADRISGLGAEVKRGASYEECVADAGRLAEQNAWIHLADGSWPGFTKSPALIMEGYTVMAEECRRQFEKVGTWPTHVFLQAGVGGMAAALAAHIRSFWNVQPEISIVEPELAPCLKTSVEAGILTRVEGDESNMGRLDCKEASMLAFNSLRNDADHFILVSDDEALAAQRLLEKSGFGSTPSAAAGLAGAIKSDLGESDQILIILSEGSLKKNPNNPKDNSK